MPSTATIPLAVELAEIEEAVGSSSFKRGKTYARTGRVLSVKWDPEESLLEGAVLGNGALYDTTVSFVRSGNALEFDEGECSCPVGYNCKHVAALVITAAPSVTTPASARDGAAPKSTAGQPGSTSPSAPAAWELPLREMISGPVRSSFGEPLAIELGLVMSGTASKPGAPRLKAKLMRPGARGGWINGSLSWGSLDAWDVRNGNYREDHLEIAREVFKIHRSRMAAGGSRYYYSSYGDRDKLIDLTDWDASQLWKILDRAARVGMVTVQAGGKLGEIPRYRRIEFLLDVTSTPEGGLSVRPGLDAEGARSMLRYAPLMFLGESGHGLVLVSPYDRDGEPQPTAKLTEMPMRLVRLERDVPVQLQRLLLAGEDLQVPPADVSRFTSQLAPALSPIVRLISSDESFEMPEVLAPELVLRAHHGADHVTSAAWTWVYEIAGERTDFVLGDDSSAPGVRDLAAEGEILDAIDLSDAPGLREIGLVDRDGRPSREMALLQGFETLRFVTETLPSLEQLGGLAVEVTGQPIEYRDLDGTLEIALSTAEVSGERDWFDLNISITIDGRELPFPLVFAALARGEERMLLDDGAYFSLQVPELEQLRQLIEEARALGEGTRPDSLRISRYQAGLWEELVGIGVVREQADAWRRQVDALKGLEELAQLEPPPGFEADLRPYQLEGFRWLATLWDLGLGGILADDMGLGKTVQALALVCHALQNPQGSAATSGTGAGQRAGAESKPFLVIAPTSVVPNWVAEARRFTPDLRVCALTDTIAKAGVVLEELAGEADIVVTTYTLVRLDEERYAGVEWAGLILDEAQAVKNHSSKTHAAVRKLPAPFKLAITGTPMENNLGELWALLSVTAPGLFPDPKAFDEHYARPIERHGESERLALLRRRIRALVKRRTKELVAADLPAKQEQILEVELHPRHRKLYDQHVQRERKRILGLLEDFDANRFTILTAITRMRQLSLHAGLVDEKDMRIPSAKLDALLEHLVEVADGGHRALVFSQFTRFLSLVRERLDAEGIGYCYLDGGTRQRGKVLTRFKQEADPVFLISLKAGGFGLNLTEADYCFLLDPWWNPAVEAQAIDRTHRIGQTRQVMVYRLVSAGTIEEKVVALAARKAALFKGVMDDGDLFAGQITAQDIRGLLG